MHLMNSYENEIYIICRHIQFTEEFKCFAWLYQVCRNVNGESHFFLQFEYKFCAEKFKWDIILMNVSLKDQKIHYTTYIYFFVGLF